MTRNKKIVIPNITYVGQQQNNSSGQISPIIKQTNLEVAKRALSRLNNPKLSNLEKAKKALRANMFNITEDFYKGLQFKVNVNSEKDVEKAKIMEELIKYVMSGGLQTQNYDKKTNRNKGGNSKGSLRAK